MNLVIANRQRVKKIDTRLLKQIIGALFSELEITEAELGINLVAAREMALVNETFLQHSGSTDVITFDYTDTGRARRSVRADKRSKASVSSAMPDGAHKVTRPTLHGELFICIDVAIEQANEFKTTWPSETVRYNVHGVLHLLGYDDLKPHLRREMKREENRLVRQLAKKFSFAQLARPARLKA
jgi:probable rRNA maturation factor